MQPGVVLVEAAATSSPIARAFDRYLQQLHRPRLSTYNDSSLNVSFEAQIVPAWLTHASVPCLLDEREQGDIARTRSIT